MGRRLGLLLVVPAVAVAVACESFDSTAEPPAVVDAGGGGDAGRTEADASPEGGASGACDRAQPFGVAAPVPGLPGDGMVSAGLTEDELQVVYASDGDAVDPGGRAGNTHLSFARRGSRSEAFGESKPLPALSVGIDQRWATFDPDGLGLWFQSVEATDSGESSIKIWRSRRANQASLDFVAPTLFTLPVPDPILGSPTVTRSGSTLYFVSGAAALHLRRVPLQPKLGSVVSLDELATGIAESTPVPTSDDLGLYYSRHTASRDEIWLARRTGLSESYTKIAAVEELNQGSLNLPVWLSADDCRLYFVSNRGGSYRIYVAEKPR